MKTNLFKQFLRTSCLCTLYIVTLYITLTSCNPSNSPRLEEDSSQFVNITDVVSDAILEIRYYGTYNFVGTRIDGYLQPPVRTACPIIR